MPKRRIKLSEHFQGAKFYGFKKFVFGRMFYFGKHSDRNSSERIALLLLQAADKLKAEGKAAWTDDVVDQIFGHAHFDNAVQSNRASEAVVVTKRVSVDVKAPTRQWALFDAFDAYVEFRKGRQISDHTRAWTAHGFRTIKRIITEHVSDQIAQNKVAPVTAATTLNEIGFDQLSKLISLFTVRPLAKKTKNAMSVNTVRSLIGYLRDCFNYLCDSGKWCGFARFERLFHVKYRKLMSVKERNVEAEGVLTFTLDELRLLYSEANDQQKLYMLLGLNAGQTQYDLATLTKQHLIDGGTRIKRLRSKTDVPGLFDLWPETHQLLAKRLTTTPKNENDLVLLTSEGNPLVWYPEGSRMDSVLQCWNRLMKHKAIREAVASGTFRILSFKYLRKTGAQLILQVSDLATSEMYLSHSGQSVAEKHYVNARDFSKLSDALLKVHKVLKEHGIFDSKATLLIRVT